MNVEFSTVVQTVIVAGMIAIGFQVFGNKNENLPVVDYKQLAANIVEAKTATVETITLEDIDKLIKKNLKGKVTGKGTITSGQKSTRQGNKGEERTLNKKYEGVVSKEIFWKNEDGQEIPIGVAIYSQKSGRWHARAYKLDFQHKIVQSREYDGTNHTYVEAWATVPNRKGFKDIDYKLDVSNAEFEVINPTALTFSLWNPNIGLGLGMTQDGANIFSRFNFINYGYEEQLPVWSILSPMVMYTPDTEEANLGIEFGSYNIGELLPVIKDLHIGAGMTIDKKFFLSIQSTL